MTPDALKRLAALTVACLTLWVAVIWAATAAINHLT